VGAASTATSPRTVRTSTTSCGPFVRVVVVPPSRELRLFLVRMGAAEETAHTILESDAHLEGHALGVGAPFDTTAGVPVCRSCADTAGLEVGAIGARVPTYRVTDESAWQPSSEPAR
jgi:hypothetical protein